MKYILLFWVLPLLPGIPKPYLDTGFISIEYAGIPNKPYPKIIYYLEGSIDTTYKDFVSKVKVDRKDFEVIRHTFETSKADLGINFFQSPALVIPDPVVINILEDGNQKTLLINNRDSLKQLFNTIAMHFNATPGAKQVIEPLEDFMFRLGVIEPERYKQRRTGRRSKPLNG